MDISKKNNKFILISVSIIIIFIVVLIIGPFLKSISAVSTTSDIKVIEKGYSEDQKELWIIAYNPNSPPYKEKLKIMIKEPMVWNLIEENKTYFSTYLYEGDDLWILKKIKYLNDDNAIR